MKESTLDNTASLSGLIETVKGMIADVDAKINGHVDK